MVLPQTMLPLAFQVGSAKQGNGKEAAGARLIRGRDRRPALLWDPILRHFVHR